MIDQSECDAVYHAMATGRGYPLIEQVSSVLL